MVREIHYPAIMNLTYGIKYTVLCIGSSLNCSLLRLFTAKIMALILAVAIVQSHVLAFVGTLDSREVY
jgi:hypothetical protein